MRKFINMPEQNATYEEKQAAKLPAHLQAFGLSKKIVRPSEGRGALAPR